MSAETATALAGHELCLGRHQFDARRGVPVGPGGRDGRRCRRHLDRCRRSCAAAFRARRIRWSRSARCAPCSACRTSCRSVSAAAASSRARCVGPRSVGYRLTREALVFGGETMTATDAAVAAGLVEIGDPGRRACAGDLADTVLQSGAGEDRGRGRPMKTEAGDLPLIAVGGGAFLVPDRLAGISQLIRVPHGDCANAVGAAIARSAAKPTKSIAISAAPKRSPGRGAGAHSRGRRRRRPAGSNRRCRGHAARLSAGQRLQGARASRRRDDFTTEARGRNIL